MCCFLLLINVKNNPMKTISRGSIECSLMVSVAAFGSRDPGSNLVNTVTLQWGTPL